jgi:glutathione-regulated potassium-efflux system ancillary protein KefG
MVSGFIIDRTRLQMLLLQHDVIIWQHPFYWYSFPPLLKQWFDMVLEFNRDYYLKAECWKTKALKMISAGGEENTDGPDFQSRFTFN